jgi:Flp pilus assembly protein TadG
MKVQNHPHGERTRSERAARAMESTAMRVEPRSIGRWFRALLRSREEGSALVEIALVTPIIMALLTGICTFAVGFNNQLTLTSAVGAGAQYLQLIRSTTTDPCADTLAAIEAAAPNLKPSSLNIIVTMDGVTPSQTGNSCPGAQVDLVEQQPITVSATYPCALAIYGTTFTNACQLRAKVSEYEY